MKTETEQLLKVLAPNMTKIEGDTQVNVDGEKYRYDEYRSKYKYTPVWLADIFNRAAKANDREFSDRFSDSGYSFYFDCARFKGQRNKDISYNKLVIL